MRLLRNRKRRRDESGVVAIALALISCFVLIPVAAMAVDLGVQRVARTDMQSLADVIALDLARHLDGESTAAQLNSASPNMQKRAEISRDKNLSTVGAAPAVVAELGTYDIATDTFTVLALNSPDVPTAVRVTASTSVDFGFMPGKGGTDRSAIAQAESSACFQLGSFAAALNPTSSPVLKDMLTPLLGSSTLTMAGYNGLASTRLSLFDLMQTSYIQAGTVNELLAVPDLSVADLFHASAQVLQAKGKVAEAAVFQNAASASSVAAATISVDDLIDLSNGSDAVLQTQFNALDILVGTVFLANGDNLLDIANLQTSLSSVGVTNSQLRLIERAQRACNNGEAKTAQLKFSSQAQVSVPSNPVYQSAGGSQLKLIDNHIDLGIDIDIAGGHGHLTDVSCDPVSFKADIWTDLVTMDVDGVLRVEGELKVPTSLLGLSLPLSLVYPSQVTVAVAFDAVVSAVANKPASAGPTPVELAMPPNTYDDHVEVGSGANTLPQVTVGIDESSLSLQVKTGTVLDPYLSGLSSTVLRAAVQPTLDVALPTITSRVGPLVNPVIDKLNDVVAQLSAVTGLNIGGADFYGLPYPNCQTPVLRG